MLTTHSHRLTAARLSNVSSKPARICIRPSATSDTQSSTAGPATSDDYVVYAFSTNGTNGSSTAETSTTTPTAPAPVPAPAPASPPQPSTAVITATKLELLEELAGLDRGTLATSAQHDRIEALVRSLESSGSSRNPFAGSPAAVEGKWQLLYTNKEVFRASPFFAAFQNGLVQDQQVAEAIFRFTDAIPGAEIGSALRTVSLLSSSLISEVDMTIFPGLTGTVVTSSRLSVLPPSQLLLDVQSTRVANSSFSPLLDSVSVPVEQLVQAVRGAGATRVVYDVTYVDDQLQVTRCADQLMVHRRLG